MTRSRTLLGVFSFIILAVSGAQATPDPNDCKGCTDHPLFTRMPDYYIQECKDESFAAIKMYDPVSKQSFNAEGRTIITEYRLPEKLKGKYTLLQVARNYTKAIKAIGGNTYEYNKYHTYMNLTKDGTEFWVHLNVHGGAGEYTLKIVERGAMKQEVAADAKKMAESIGQTGHMAVYGIYFDFNQSEVKPESEPALEEISKLLSNNPNLKVFIVGHTDNVGKVDFNMRLSQDRADAVKKALASKYQVSPQRMESYGVGQMAPMASNKTEEGRAKNRRVELVEQ